MAMPIEDGSNQYQPERSLIAITSIEDRISKVIEGQDT